MERQPQSGRDPKMQMGPPRPVPPPRAKQMAPNIRSHQKSRGAKHSVHPQYWTDGALCQITWGDYLCVVSPTEPNPPQVGRMDSTGFEPASRVTGSFPIWSSYFCGIARAYGRGNTERAIGCVWR